MTDIGIKGKGITKFTVLTAIGIGVLFWLLESAVELFVLHPEADPLDALLPLDHHELWMRILIVLLAISVTVLVHSRVIQRRTEKLLEQSKENYRKNYMKQETITEVLQQTLKPFPLKKQMERILDIVLGTPLFGDEGKGCIFIFDETRNKLRLQAQKGMPPGMETVCSLIDLGQCLCGRAAASKEVLFADRIDNRHEIHYHDMTPHGQYCIPVLSADKLRGVLTFYVKTGFRRNKEDEPFFSSIAHAIAGVIEREQTEIALRESEEKFRTLFDQATDSIFLISPTTNDLYIEDLNEAACTIHGYTRKELIGKSIGMLDDPETRKLLPERIPILLSGKPLHAEAMHVRKDGSTFPIEISAQLVEIGGKPYILAVDRDITKHRKAEEELKERIRLAELNASIGIALTEGETLSQMLQGCAQALVDHLDALFARIWVFNEAENILELRASAGLYTRLDGEHSRKVPGKYKIGIIAKERTPILTNDVVGDPNISDQEWAKREKIAAFAGHPLIVENNLVGVMALFSRKKLHEITLTSLEPMADIIAIGIEQKLAEEKIILAKDEWERTFDIIPDLITVIDKNYRIVNANNAMAEILGMKREEIIGKRCYTVIHGSDAPPDYCPHIKCTSTGKACVDEIYEAKLRGHFIMSANPVFDKEGNVTGSVQVARDISKRKEMEQKLEEAAITDELTGLFNRRGFFTLAEHQVKLADRTKRKLALLYMDLDGFKDINDKLGHKAGDEALVDTARILRKTFRVADIIARIGGDEFVVLLTEPSESRIEQIIKNHLQKNLQVHNEQGLRSYELNVSMGMSEYNPEQPCSLSDLLTKADELMYEDKEQNKLKNHVAPLLKERNVPKRVYKRFSTGENCWAELDVSGKVKIKNISIGGTRLVTPQPLTTNNIYKIRMLPRENEEITLTGIVVWSSPTESRREKDTAFPYESGLKFTELSDSSKSSLEKMIEHLNI